MNLVGCGFERRLRALSTTQLWEVTYALDIDPERLPWADHTRPSELSRRLRGAILREMRDEARAGLPMRSEE